MFLQTRREFLKVSSAALAGLAFPRAASGQRQAAGPVFVNNADEVRLLMRRRGNVIAAFHGHHHAGDHREIDGIHFYTLRAVVEGSGLDNSSYAIVGVHADGLTITGYRRAVSHDLLEAP